MTVVTGHVGGAGLDTDTLLMMLDALDEFVGHELTPQRQLDLDHEDVCPEDLVRAMSDPEQLGVQLVFIPEAFGGMDGGAFDSYRICEVMGRHDIGFATAVFATFLGSDPILVGATDEQRDRWLRGIAEDGVVFAYGATRARRRQRSGFDEDHCRPDRGGRRDHRLPHQRTQAVDLQRIDRRHDHRAGDGTGRAVLVRGPQRHPWLRRSEPGGQTRHSPVEHRRTLPRRRRRSCRPLDRWRRREGARAGTAGVRLHPGRWSPPSVSGEAGRRSTGRSSTRSNVSRVAHRSPRSRASRTS